MHMLRSTLGLLALAAVACLGLAAPAAAQSPVFLNAAGITAPAAIHKGLLIALGDNVLPRKEVGMSTRNDVCTPGGFTGTVALRDAGTTFAPPEVGAAPGSNVAGIETIVGKKPIVVIG